MMLTRFVIVALIAGLAYLNYTNPTEAQHKQAILAEIEKGWPISEDLQQTLWKNMDFSNLMVCSFMKTTIGSDFVSTGYLNKVKVVNPKWVEETAQTLQKRQGF